MGSTTLKGFYNQNNLWHSHLEVSLLVAIVGWVSSVSFGWVHSKWVCSEPGGRSDKLRGNIQVHHKHCLQCVLAAVARTQRSGQIKRAGSWQVPELTPLLHPSLGVVAYRHKKSSVRSTQVKKNPPQQLTWGTAGMKYPPAAGWNWLMMVLAGKALMPAMRCMYWLVRWAFLSSFLCARAT